jgi:peptidoglycan/LPS O-acetylase OafA/YrhL
MPELEIWGSMKMRLWSSILFVILFVATVSFDYFGRYLFPNNSLCINLFMIPLTVISLSLFLISVRWTLRRGPEKIRHPEKIQLHRNVFAPLLAERDSLLALRFFAAFLVFATHMAILLRPPIVANFNAIIWGAAWSGMTIFFTLSGYLMGKAFVNSRYDVTRRGIFEFYQSRFTRIFPLMIFIFVIFVVLEYPQIFRFNLTSVIRILTFTYYGNTLQYDGIGAIWSLSVEMQYYAIAPFIFLLFEKIHRKNRFVAIAGLLFIVLLLQGQKVPTNHFIFSEMKIIPNFFSLLGNIPFFLVGFLFNYVRISVPKFLIELLNRSWTQALFFVGLFVCASLIQNSILGRIHLNQDVYFIGLSFVTSFVILLLNAIGEKRKLASDNQFDFFRILQILGSLSYGLYLWHSGVGFVYSKLFSNGFHDILSYLVEVFVVFVIVLLMSLGSYILVESRFNQYKSINERIARQIKPNK